MIAGLNRYVNTALLERQRFAPTADIWVDLARWIGSKEPICFKHDPYARRVAYFAWQLSKILIKDTSSPSGIYTTAEMHLIITLLLIGLLDRSLCDCFTCVRANMEVEPLIYSERNP